MATEQNIIIKFTSDTTGLQPAIEQLRLIGKITDEDAKRIADINAEQQKFNSTVNETTNEFTDFQKTFKNLSADIKAQVLVEAANQLKEFSTEANNGGNKIKSLKTELRELKAQIASGSLGEKEMREATKRAAELTDHLGDVQEKIKGLSSDTKRLDAVVTAFRGIAAAVSVGTGAMALFGAENKELEKTLLKVQGAMALLQGVQELATIATGNSTLKTYAFAAAETVAAKASKVLGVEITAATAMATAGVSLLIAGIAYLLVEMNDSTEELEKMNLKAAEFYKTNEEAFVQLQKLRANSIKDARARELRINQIAGNEELNNLQERFKKGEIVAELYESLYVEIKKKYTLQKEAIEKKYNDEAIQKADKLANELKDRQAKFDLEADKQRRARLDKQAEIDGQQAEDEMYFEASKQQELLDTKREGQEAWIAMSNEMADQEEKDKEQRRKDELDAEKKLIAERLALRKEIEKAIFEIAQLSINTLFTLTSQNIKATEDAEIESINKRRDADLKSKDITEAQKAKIDERAAKEISRAKQKAWKDQQSADIAQAVINGALAITKTFSTLGYPLGIPAAIVQAAVTASQVAIIKNQPVPKFAKGTKKVLGAGTGTSDDIDARLSLGEMVFTNKTAADYNPALTAIFDRKVNPQIANDLLTDLANGSYNINPEYHSTTTNNLDYNKLGQIVKQGQSKVVINIDKNGLLHYKEDSFGKTQYVNSKFKYTL